ALVLNKIRCVIYEFIFREWYNTLCDLKK
ncbi:MAG: hypothetical protein RL235_687, partial [Chlamydiota bacterium]